MDRQKYEIDGIDRVIRMSAEKSTKLEEEVERKEVVGRHEFESRLLAGWQNLLEGYALHICSSCDSIIRSNDGLSRGETHILGSCFFPEAAIITMKELPVREGCKPFEL